jgi:hypothetical protein
MLITRGFGLCSGEGGTGANVYVPICGTSMDITGASSSRVKGREALSKISADSAKLTPILTSEVEEAKTIIDVTQLKPIIKPKG